MNKQTVRRFTIAGMTLATVLSTQMAGLTAAEAATRHGEGEGHHYHAYAHHYRYNWRFRHDTFTGGQQDGNGDNSTDGQGNTVSTTDGSTTGTTPVISVATTPTPPVIPVATTPTPPTVPVTTTTGLSNSTTASLPPGVQYDSSIQPVAGLDATWQQKMDAILSVSQSKLGTPYIWGHNEDRGQYGFDCSNFTAYVYHHALGYKFSGASRVQASSVGQTVPIQDMRPGDLLIDDNGGHVGIYVGNGQMIQEGGGLRKVGYLKVTPGSYWYNHITAVKRMF